MGATLAISINVTDCDRSSMAWIDASYALDSAQLEEGCAMHEAKKAIGDLALIIGLVIGLIVLCLICISVAICIACFGVTSVCFCCCKRMTKEAEEVSEELS